MGRDIFTLRRTLLNHLNCPNMDIVNTARNSIPNHSLLVRRTIVQATFCASNEKDYN
jgi:hypothetical protein